MALVNLIKLNQIETAAAIQEGLPFWLFWFLITVIGLLLFFIFLRDKELRRRIDFFFLSARNRSFQIHLRRQMKREKKKKERLWLELGRIVYENKMAISGTEAIMKSIETLERKKEQLLSQLNNFHNSLKIFPTDTASSQSINQEFNLDQAIKAKNSDSAPTQLNEKNAKLSIAWKKKQGKLEGKIKDLEEEASSLLTTLGRIADTFRFKDEKLASFYEKIDAVNAKLSHLEQRLDSLRPF